MAVRFDASGDRLYTTANPPAANAYTLCGWAVLASDINTTGAVCAVENGLTSAGETQCIATDSDGTTIRLFGDGAFSAAGFTPGLGVPFFFAMVATGTGASGLNAYLRTASQNSFATLTRNGNIFTPSHVFIGNDSYAEYWPGDAWNVKQWNRALSAEELLIESFYARPMFPASLNFWWPLHNASDTADRSGNGRNPTVGGTLTTQDGPVNLWVPRRRIILPASVAGATDLVTQESTHGHTADNLTLTTATTLSIAGCTHAHTADALTLSTGTALVVNEASHAHAADALTLSTGTSLTVAEASHAHTADSLGLTTDSTLAVADASHGHTAENLTLVPTTGDTLVVQDATHAHSADTLALTTDQFLYIADSVHAHTADQIILSTQLGLSVDDATHGHAADSPALSDTPALQIANSLHGHTADGLAFTLDTWLAIQDARHIHRADSFYLWSTADEEIEVQIDPRFIAKPAARNWSAKSAERNWLATSSPRPWEVRR